MATDNKILVGRAAHTNIEYRNGGTMNGFISSMIVVLCTVLIGGHGCSSDLEKNLATCKSKETACQSQMDKLKSELKKLRPLSGQVSQLEKQVKQLTQTPDGHWRTANQLQEDGALEGAERAYTSFLNKFPNDNRSREARKRISVIAKQRRKSELLAAKQRKEQEKRRKQEELIARLDSVTVDQIVADPKAYRKQTFRRRICCERPERDLMGRYIVSCYWKLDGSTVDLDSKVLVKIKPAIAHRFPDEAEKVDRTFCKYMVEGDLYFGGLIIPGHGAPLMKLTKGAVQNYLVNYGRV